MQRPLPLQSKRHKLAHKSQAKKTEHAQKTNLRGTRSHFRHRGTSAHRGRQKSEQIRPSNQRRRSCLCFRNIKLMKNCTPTCRCSSGAGGAAKRAEVIEFMAWGWDWMPSLNTDTFCRCSLSCSCDLKHSYWLSTINYWGIFVQGNRFLKYFQAGNNF